MYQRRGDFVGADLLTLREVHGKTGDLTLQLVQSSHQSPRK